MGKYIWPFDKKYLSKKIKLHAENIET